VPLFTCGLEKEKAIAKGVKIAKQKRPLEGHSRRRRRRNLSSFDFFCFIFSLEGRRRRRRRRSSSFG
jgi:hypothetical protein